MQHSMGLYLGADLKTTGRVEETVIRRRQYAAPDAGSGANSSWVVADMAGQSLITAGNVLFIAATADNYLRAAILSNGENRGRAV